MIQAIINKDSKEHLLNNLKQQIYNDRKQYNMVIDILYPDIDINTFPTDIVKLIKGYYDDDINTNYSLNNIENTLVGMTMGNENKLTLLRDYLLYLNIMVSNCIFSVTEVICYVIDNKIINVTKYNKNTKYNTNLIAIINHYMMEKYKINDYIPSLCSHSTKITSIQKNYYKCITVFNIYDNITMEDIEIVDEVLFEVVIAIVSELVSCLCAYLKN